MANSPKLSLASSLLEEVSAPLPSNETPLVVMHAAVTASPDVQRCLLSIINDATKNLFRKAYVKKYGGDIKPSLLVSRPGST